MKNLNRRRMLEVSFGFVVLPSAFQLLGCTSKKADTTKSETALPDQAKNSSTENEAIAAENEAMKIHYLEIVTPEVDAICDTYAQVHGVKFGEKEPGLGEARTAKMADGGIIGIRAPMRETEQPVVRHYILVDDIQAKVDAAEKAGAKVALPPMDLPGHGTCAIVIQGGIEFGFWQL